MSLSPSKETTFVRQHPGKKPADVVALAAKAGLKIDAKKVNNVRKSDRAEAKRKARASGGAKVARRQQTRPVAPASTGATSPERELRRIVIELGLVRSAAILADVRARVLAALG